MAFIFTKLFLLLTLFFTILSVICISVASAKYKVFAKLFLVFIIMAMLSLAIAIVMLFWR